MFSALVVSGYKLLKQVKRMVKNEKDDYSAVFDGLYFAGLE